MSEKKTKKKKLIYLVEDDWGIIDVYKTGLETMGDFKVEVFRFCSDVKERIEKLANKKTKKPDLILLDLLLPECNGIELLQEIRSKEEIKDLPVIIITNYGGSELRGMGGKLDAIDYIIKTDVTPSKLVKIIKEKLK